jgi:hypothetical protein
MGGPGCGALGRDLKQGLQVSSVLRGPNQFRGGTASQEEIDGIDDNRFSSARLPGQYGEAFFKADGKIVNDSEVSYREFPKHELSSASLRKERQGRIE